MKNVFTMFQASIGRFPFLLSYEFVVHQQVDQVNVEDEQGTKAKPQSISLSF